MRRAHGYFQATRHPWPCLLFLLPLLLLYEGGVLWLSAANPELLRNGADTWLRRSLEAFGLGHPFTAPACLVAVLLLWTLTRIDDRPDDALGAWAGMALESVLFALGLWVLGRGLRPFLASAGVVLGVNVPGEEVAGRIITFVGAGIYEELIFRLLLFRGLLLVLVLFRSPGLLALFVSAAVSAALFAAAHHYGPQGERFDQYAFLFRLMAGLYFVAVFQLRGFGIVVGAHILYDVLAGAGVR